MTRQPYPTDLPDAQWAVLEPLLPPARWWGRPRTVDLREVLNFCTSPGSDDLVEVPRVLVERFTDALCYAA
jgi:transposase